MNYVLTPKTGANMIGATDVLQMARGFFASRIILSAAELELFEKLPADALSLAQKNSWDADALTILLDALTAIELLDKKDGIYRLRGNLIDALGDEPEKAVLPMIAHLNTLWKKWSDLSDIVRKGRNTDAPSTISKDKDAMRPFIGAMHVIGKTMAASLVPKLLPVSAKKMLDVGGASGTYLIEFLKQLPDISATLFDLPDVISLAEERVSQQGLSARVNFAPGDFYKDPLPGGHDLVWLSAIIHQNSRTQNVALFEKCFNALESGGRLWIRDHIMDEQRVNPPAGAIFAVNMLVVTRGGSTYTLSEVSRDLETAGFVSPKIIHEGENMDTVVEAIKP